MTTHRDFKRRVRERMAKTGESYTAARAAILAAEGGSTSSPTSIRGLFKGYDSVGGICRDTGALRNVLSAAGVTAAHSKKPISEAVVTGLCGGVGFLYAVFEYKGWPPMLSVLCRHDTMPDSFIAGGLNRLGLSVNVSETASAAAARKALDRALAAGLPALCVIDCAGLAAENDARAKMRAGMAPTVVAVAGVDGDDLLVDDGGVVLRRMSHEQFARARALYKKAKNRLVTIEAVPRELDLAAGVRDAVRATAARYLDAPWKSFAVNNGLSGIEKWRRLLTDAHDKKGWPTLFGEPRTAYLALIRAHDGIEHEFTPPAAGRTLYAEFLTEAASITGDERFLKAADLYRRAGEGWRAVSDAIATCGDAAVEKGCALGGSICELFDDATTERRRGSEPIESEGVSLARSCTLTKADAATIYAALAERLGEVLSVEREAVATLQSLGAPSA